MFFRGLTHKNSVKQYCEEKIKTIYQSEQPDKDSAVLIWKLLVKLIQQNGVSINNYLHCHRNLGKFHKDLQVQKN